MKQLFFAAISGWMMLTGVSCAKLKPVFDPDAFERNIVAGVNANNTRPVGWSYIITRNGTIFRSDTFGRARLPADGALPFSLDKKINIASVSKFYTAIGAMQLLNANGLTINSPIGPWLPSTWAQGPWVSSLSFRDLLTHTSGLTSVNTNMDSTVGYEGLRSCIATGATSPFPPGSVVAQTRPFQYLNVNYALFRVLIPSLWRGQPGSPFIDINDDQLTQTRYLQYMQQFVFDPINMPNINCSPEPRGIATLYYNITDSAQNRRGDFLGDWTHIAGGGGYYMTPREMARGAAFFEETQILLPNSVKQIMKQNRIGFVPRIAALETRGDYFAHDGGITNDSINNRGLQTVICIFPNGFQCSITMNTRGVTYPDNQTIIRMVYSAYNNAWLN